MLKSLHTSNKYVTFVLSFKTNKNSGASWIKSGKNKMNTNNMTAQGARKEKIFVVNFNSKQVDHYYSLDKDGNKKYMRNLVIKGFEVEETNLLDFVYISAEGENESKKLRIREVDDNECDDKCHLDEDGEWEINRECKKCNGFGQVSTFEVYTYDYHRRNKTIVYETFDTEEEAEDCIFQRIYEYDFQTDDQRDCTYFDTKEEAFDYGVERMAESNGKSTDVIVRYLNFRNYCENIQFERNAIAKAEYEERINKLSDVYAAMIETEAEGYKQTCGRLKLALGGERIESSVFHTAVKKIRNRK